MTKEQLAGLPAKIRAATQAGHEAADACPDDGGSANLDHVVIPMRGVRASAVKGLPGDLWDASTWHPRGLHLAAPFAGIGNRRAAGVQAMHKSLQAQGVSCYVYYQLD